MDELDRGFVACLVALWRFPLVRTARRAYPPLVSKRPLHLSTSEPDNAKVQAVREALMAWFDENGRELPWRRTRDPWRNLLSEVMLQQIQVPACRAVDASPSGTRTRTVITADGCLPRFARHPKRAFHCANSAKACVKTLVRKSCPGFTASLTPSSFWCRTSSLLVSPWSPLSLPHIGVD
jgi:hypothetical protein